MTSTWKSEWPSWLCLAAMFALLALSWSSAPDRIPVHWNLRGEVDRFGNRFEGLALMPIFGVVLYLLLRFLPAIDPRKANYDSFRTAYDVIRHGTLALMAILYGLTVAILRGASIDMALAVSALVGVFFVVIGLLFPTVRPNWFFGFRTPWTLSSDVAWARAQRVAGWTFVATGVAIAAAGWFRTAASITVVVSILLAGMAIAAWVSFIAWRDDPARTR